MSSDFAALPVHLRSFLFNLSSEAIRFLFPLVIYFFITLINDLRIVGRAKPIFKKNKRSGVRRKRSDRSSGSLFFHFYFWIGHRKKIGTGRTVRLVGLVSRSCWWCSKVFFWEGSEVEKWRRRLRRKCLLCCRFFFSFSVLFSLLLVNEENGTVLR